MCAGMNEYTHEMSLYDELKAPLNSNSSLLLPLLNTKNTGISHNYPNILLFREIQRLHEIIDRYQGLDIGETNRDTGWVTYGANGLKVKRVSLRNQFHTQNYLRSDYGFIVHQQKYLLLSYLLSIELSYISLGFHSADTHTISYCSIGTLATYSSVKKLSTPNQSL